MGRKIKRFKLFKGKDIMTGTYEEIATALGITINTIRSYNTNQYRDRLSKVKNLVNPRLLVEVK